LPRIGWSKWGAVNELQIELKKQLNRYGREKIAPFMEEDDAGGVFRKEIYQGLGELGVCGITLPEEYSGSGLGYQDVVVVLEEIGKYSVSYAITVSVSLMVQSIINKYGTTSQKKKYIPELALGKEIASFALTETVSGSDAAALKTSAKKVKDGYELNGTKMFVTSGGISKTYLVMARTGGEGPRGISAFIVTDGTKGFSYGKAEKKMGWKVSPTRELIFDQCIIPKENLLGRVGEGFIIAMDGLDRGRMTVASVAVGLSQMSIDKTLNYALERKQFKQEIFHYQGLQFMLADMATETEASRLLTREAARLYDQGNFSQKLGSMAKLKATDTAMKVTTDAVQILGAVGYSSEFPVERFMRDAKALQIVEGTNQIQRIVIARNLKKERS